MGVVSRCELKSSFAILKIKMAAVASNALPLTFGVRKGDTKERMKETREGTREKKREKERKSERPCGSTACR